MARAVKARLSVIVFGWLVVAVPAFAQQPGQPSLADVARRVEADRANATAKKATKNYTNKDLSALPDLADAPTEEDSSAAGKGFMSRTLGKEVTAEEIVKRSEQRPGREQEVASEESWRERSKKIRDDVENLKVRLDRLMRGAPPTDPSRLQKQQNDIAAIHTSFGQLQSRWDALDRAAKDAKIDMNWLTPAPQFPPPQ